LDAESQARLRVPVANRSTSRKLVEVYPNDLKSAHDTVQAVPESRMSGMAAKKSSRVVLRDDSIFTGYSSNGYSVPLDTNRASGGHDAGFSPMELLLTALGGCTGMDVISILRKKRQDVTGLEIQVEGVRADEHPRVYTQVWVKFIVTGHSVDPAAVERAIELSRDKYCGVSATLQHTATFHYSHEIIEAAETEKEMP
jgi:putative redox protein